ncbi:MAG: hypothetical protein AAFV53_23330 [Myxococcota bacterium]
MDLIASIVGFFTVNGAIYWYFLTINREKVPAPVMPFASVVIFGLIFSLGGFALTPSVLTGAMMLWAVSLGGLILYLLSMRQLPDGHLIVHVGEPMPPITAIDHNGQPFDLSSLKERRVMFKFFRGSW